MDKVFQVFVSSTFSDLADERRQVTNTLAKAGYVAAGMELFPATDQQQLDFIKRVIDRSDYYVVIVAGRYGSMADDKLSFTEHEYEYAMSKGIPVLAFLHAEPDKIEAGKTDKDPDKVRSLEAFRKRLSTGRIVDFWKFAPDLCTTVLTAVVQTTNLFPAQGWVRGDQAIDPKVLQELEKLRSENAALAAQLKEIAGAPIIFPSNLPAPTEEVSLNISVNVRNAYSDHRFISTWQAIFIDSIDDILNEKYEREIGTALAMKYGRTLEPHLEYASIDPEQLRQIRIQLEALGLINAVATKRERNGRSIQGTSWLITEKGRRYMSENLALKN